MYWWDGAAPTLPAFGNSVHGQLSGSVGCSLGETAIVLFECPSAKWEFGRGGQEGQLGRSGGVHLFPFRIRPSR